jgi:hypothetical protein
MHTAAENRVVFETEFDSSLFETNILERISLGKRLCILCSVTFHRHGIGSGCGLIFSKLNHIGQW